MKIITGIVTLTILSVNVYSQKGFYLHPAIENKSHINNKGWPGGYPDEVVTVKGDKFQVYPINFYNDYNKLGAGLHAGYHTNKMFFEAGWSSDRARVATRVTALCMANDSTYFMDEVSNSKSIPLNKFPIRIGTKISGKDSVARGKHVRWQCFLYAGIDLLRPSPRIKNQVYTHDFMIIPNQYAHYQYKADTAYSLRSYSISMGIQLKAYNKKGKNIINLGIHYSQGTKNLLFSHNNFINYDGANYEKLGSRSKASGLYISISKDIYPGNFIRRTKLPALF